MKITVDKSAVQRSVGRISEITANTSIKTQKKKKKINKKCITHLCPDLIILTFYYKFFPPTVDIFFYL